MWGFYFVIIGVAFLKILLGYCVGCTVILGVVIAVRFGEFFKWWVWVLEKFQYPYGGNYCSSSFFLFVLIIICGVLII
jgi:hypothetical protein